ncbi:hypothetical protein AX774_g3106 [Zancudomyces culisetae]|uniref:Uncharacterized protein n=1 Tax=Zancudomyces culisetae TaxID=1213189 RepID=A0A1R1PR19_ZANCU|nr:hypothetical protein AX774_g3106 [Zancudomyces culisetae]|eukprot:OMH83389.1 hypothetical protein AX774_g3106 [Zancudomyces culisetae]
MSTSRPHGSSTSGVTTEHAAQVSIMAIVCLPNIVTTILQLELFISSNVISFNSVFLDFLHNLTSSLVCHGEDSNSCTIFILGNRFSSLFCSEN